jgi:hypothetical protein
MKMLCKNLRTTSNNVVRPGGTRATSTNPSIDRIISARSIKSSQLGEADKRLWSVCLTFRAVPVGANRREGQERRGAVIRRFTFWNAQYCASLGSFAWTGALAVRVVVRQCLCCQHHACIVRPIGVCFGKASLDGCLAPAGVIGFIGGRCAGTGHWKAMLISLDQVLATKMSWRPPCRQSPPLIITKFPERTGNAPAMQASPLSIANSCDAHSRHPMLFNTRSSPAGPHPGSTPIPRRAPYASRFWSNT